MEKHSNQETAKLPVVSDASSGPLADNGSTEINNSSKENDSQHTLTDWDGPDDPGKPWNWPLPTKIYGVLVPAWYSFSVYADLIKDDVCAGLRANDLTEHSAHPFTQLEFSTLKQNSMSVKPWRLLDCRYTQLVSV